MNIYKYHTTPEELYGHEEAIPAMARAAVHEYLTDNDEMAEGNLITKLKELNNSKPIPAAEKEILKLANKAPHMIYVMMQYAEEILGHRWPEAEPYIKHSEFGDYDWKDYALEWDIDK